MKKGHVISLVLVILLIILAVKANLSNKTWETLKNYAQDNNIKIWKIKNG